MRPVKKVILPKDIYAVLEREQSFLNRSGIKTFATLTNEEALALHKSEKADLIVSYLNMPGMKGDALCSLIRRNDELSRVSIILVCPHSAADDERCIQSGANSFITIPIHTNVLLHETYQLLHIAPRESCRIPVRVNIEGTSRGKAFAGLIENISTSGILFRSEAIFNEGDKVKCSFSAVGSAKVNVSAEIVRVTDKQSELDTYIYGVRFVEPGDNVISAIEALQKKVADPAT